MYFDPMALEELLDFSSLNAIANGIQQVPQYVMVSQSIAGVRTESINLGQQELFDLSIVQWETKMMRLEGESEDQQELLGQILQGGDAAGVLPGIF